MGATWTKRGRSFRVMVGQGGQRASITVRTKGDAESLCREIIEDYIRDASSGSSHSPRASECKSPGR